MRSAESFTFSLSYSIPAIVQEACALLAGACLVALPMVAGAKVLSGLDTPTVQQIELPTSSFQFSNTSSTEHIVPENQSAPVPKVVNSKELECLAHNIYFEARNQDQFGQLLVAFVTIVRQREPRWPPSTICGIVYQHKQFSWTHQAGHSMPANSIDQVAMNDARKLAYRVLAGEFDNVLEFFNANHYHTTQVKPNWARNMNVVVSAGDHIFYTD